MKKRRWRRKYIGLFSRINLLINYGFVLLLLFSYLASLISPAVCWPLSFIGLAYPFLILINILFILYWLLRKPVYAIFSVTAILIGIKFLDSTIGLQYPQAPTDPLNKTANIRVMTWNVHSFKPFDPKVTKGSDSLTRRQMLEIIRDQKPDILCLQEYYSKRRGENNVRAFISDILKSEHYYIYEDFGNPWEQQGLAIFSRYELQDQGSIKFPNADRGNEAMYADFTIRAKRFRLYNIHLQSIRFQPEDYQYLQDIRKINTNVESSLRIGDRLKRAFIKRAEQVELLRKHIKNYNGNYIIAGDFNDTPVSYAVNVLSTGMQNSFRIKGTGLGITYNGAFPNFQIDYILASPVFEIKSYSTIRKKLSDHYPVICDMAL